MSEHNNTHETSSSLFISRRTLLKGLAGIGAAALCSPAVIIPKVPQPTLSTVIPEVEEKALSFYNIHTGEFLNKCTFWADGKFNHEGLREINTLFRDYRTGDICEIDQDLLTLLHRIAHELDTTETIHLISGYRSPKTNKLLASRSRGVAKHSQHIQGKAADIAIPGRSMQQIQRIAKSLKMGGVGRYHDFVHVDTGRVRYWGRA